MILDPDLDLGPDLQKSAFTMTSTSTSRYIHVGSMSVLDNYPGERPESGISNWEQVEHGQHDFLSTIRSGARKLLKARPNYTPSTPSPLRCQMEQQVELEDYTTIPSRLSAALGAKAHHASSMLNRLRSIHKCRKSEEAERWVSVEIKQVVTQHLL